jgi:hypothetical protein
MPLRSPECGTPRVLSLLHGVGDEQQLRLSGVGAGQGLSRGLAAVWWVGVVGSRCCAARAERAHGDGMVRRQCGEGDGGTGGGREGFGVVNVLKNLGETRDKWEDN